MVTEIRGSTVDQNAETGEWGANVKWHCTSYAEAKSVVSTTYNGLDLLTRRIVPYDRVAGQFVAECTYGGTEEDGDDSEDDGSFEIVPEEREEPIENFPDRDYLITEYGGYEDNGVLKFPMRIPRKTDSRTGLAPSRVAKPWSLGGKDNPLFNARTYPVVYEVAVRVFFRKRFPVRLLKDAGKIIERLPSGFEDQGPDRQWWVERPHRVKVGTGWRITWRARSLEGLPMLAAVIKGLEATETNS